MLRTSTIALTLSFLLLAACSRGGDGGTGAEASDALWGHNLTLNASGHPKAEISAKGDFIVGGKAVPVTDAQRSLVIAYHRELGGIADAGIATGKEGAKLAGKAVGAAVKGLFSGNPDQIEQQIEAEAKKVEAEAMKICDRLPGLYQAQQALAAALPQFQPYAGLDLDDTQDCRNGQDDDGAVASRDAAGEADAAAAAEAPSP